MGPSESKSKPDSSKSDLNPDSELKTNEMEPNRIPMTPIAEPSHAKESKTDSYAASDSHSNEISELEQQREASRQLQKALLDELFSNPDFQQAIAAQRKPPVKRASVKRERVRHSIETPMEVRRSDRLRKSNPVYTPTDDPEENMHKAKRRRLSGSRVNSSYSKIPRVIVPVEEITHAHINNVAQTVASKKYCARSGTSCHQCRQKTTDQKTCCRNPDCVGVRGQFCGVCLRNRYGEDAVAALQDPNWHCPVCRGICNCSFCRIKEGSCPTGILTPVAFKRGFSCVKDYLDSIEDAQDPENNGAGNNNGTGDTNPEIKYKVSEETSNGSNTKDSGSSNEVDAAKCSTVESDLSSEPNIIAGKIGNTDGSVEVIKIEDSSESSSSSIHDLDLELGICHRDVHEDYDLSDDDEDGGKRLLGFKDGVAVFR